MRLKTWTGFLQERTQTLLQSVSWHSYPGGHILFTSVANVEHLLAEVLTQTPASEQTSHFPHEGSHAAWIVSECKAQEITINNREVINREVIIIERIEVRTGFCASARASVHFHPSAWNARILKSEAFWICGGDSLHCTTYRRKARSSISKATLSKFREFSFYFEETQWT